MGKTLNRFTKLTIADIIASVKSRLISFKGAIVWYFRSLQKPGWTRIYNLGEIVSLFSMSMRTLRRIIRALREGNEFAIATAGVGAISVTRHTDSTDNSDIDRVRSLTSPPPESKLSSSKKVLPTPSRLQSESREESSQAEKTGSGCVNPSQSFFVNRGLTRDDVILTSPSEDVNTQPDSLTEDVESSESSSPSGVLDFTGDSTDIDQVIEYMNTEVVKRNPHAKPACLVNVSGEDKISSNGFFIPVTDALANPRQCVETILQSFSPPPSSLLNVLRDLKQRNLEKFGPRINWNRKR